MDRLCLFCNCRIKETDRGYYCGAVCQVMAGCSGTHDPRGCWIWQKAKRENGYGVMRVWGSMYVTKQKNSDICDLRDRPELEWLVFDAVIRELEAFFDGGYLGQGLIEAERREIALGVSQRVCGDPSLRRN